jgi:hypothetical protein
MLKGAISMIIYLYKKTHNITGLQYLGKTSKDPLKYKGSGNYWVLHIKKHGYDVATEILKECKTNDEVKYWGLYYSNLWNVVVDPMWANMRPEEGSGGATRTGTTQSNTMKMKVSGHNHYTKRNGYDLTNHHNKGRDKKGSKNSRYDPKIYTFQHIHTNQIESSTRYDLAQKYNLNLGNISKVFSGKYKHCGGWKLI